VLAAVPSKTLLVLYQIAARNIPERLILTLRGVKTADPNLYS